MLSSECGHHHSETISWLDDHRIERRDHRRQVVSVLVMARQDKARYLLWDYSPRRLHRPESPVDTRFEFVVAGFCVDGLHRVPRRIAEQARLDEFESASVDRWPLS